jgi:hypothetical protein
MCLEKMGQHANLVELQDSVTTPNCQFEQCYSLHLLNLPAGHMQVPLQLQRPPHGYHCKPAVCP